MQTVDRETTDIRVHITDAQIDQVATILGIDIARCVSFTVAPDSPRLKMTVVKLIEDD